MASSLPPAPPSPAAPPPVWMPTAAQPLVPRAAIIPLLALWGRIIGFVLLFVGTLIAVAWGNIPGGCLTTPSSCTGFPAADANAILAAQVIWTIGLFFLGGGAGIKLHWGLQNPASGRPEDVRWVVADRWVNVVLVVLSIWLMFSLLMNIRLITGLP